MADKPRQRISAATQPEDKLGERLKLKRIALGLNYEQLARLTVEYDVPGVVGVPAEQSPGKKGLTAAMIARYERGVKGRPVMPGARELRLLCDALDVAADWLLYGRELPKADAATVRLADAASKFVKAAAEYKFFESVMGASSDSDAAKERAAKLARVKQQPLPPAKPTRST
jgi:transcriptional regulator with XRE-family HTH domain